MNKKGGASEFLMTYGWALLVVIVATTVLWWFGVLTPVETDSENSIIEESKCLGSLKVYFNREIVMESSTDEHSRWIQAFGHVDGTLHEIIIWMNITKEEAKT